MNNKKYQIFISSTYEDLKEEREAAMKTILKLYHIPIGMEMFNAGNDDQWTVISRTIDTSDYYVVIIGHRYGSTTDSGISYTEKEYDYAVNKGIPVLTFIKYENTASMSELRESDPNKQEKLSNFKKRTKDKMVVSWKTKEDFAAQLSTSLSRIFIDNPRKGWIPDDFDHIAMSKTNDRLSEENCDLRNKLSSIENKITNSISGLEVSTFTLLKNAVSNALFFTHTCILITGDIILSEDITIPSDKCITIKSTESNKFTISTVKRCRHFIVSNNAALTLENIIIDGRSVGGGINNDGELILKYGTIINKCYAFSSNGGGICSSGTVIVNESDIIGNSAFFGGGIYNSGTLEIINSRIIGNKANSGGGIYANSANIKNCEIIDNTADYSGGGICKLFMVFFTNIRDIIVSDTVFSGNTANQAYWMTDADDIAIHNAQIKGVKQLSAPPISNKPFEYAFNNYDIGYIKWFTKNP